jgi:hypothetical protein
MVARGDAMPSWAQLVGTEMNGTDNSWAASLAISIFVPPPTPMRKEAFDSCAISRARATVSAVASPAS